MNIRIYEISTETKDTLAGHTYDRFNVAATSFDQALEKAKKQIARYGRDERIQAVHVLAQESD